MKILFVILLFLSFVDADEMGRIEAIVADITELRAEYNQCLKELDSKDTSSTKKYKKLYKKEKERNTILKAELEYNSDLAKSNESLSKKVKELEKELKIKNNLLKTKEITIKKLTQKQDNFPKLIMKEEIEVKDIELIKFKATSFKLKYDSIVYNSINGKMITKWVKDTSFTSTTKTKSWIKVTGYFINKKWTSAKKEMWIKIKQVEKK